MKNKSIVIATCWLISISFLLFSCGKEKSSESTMVDGNPQYGGQITTAVTSLMSNFDVYSFIGAESNLWYESLFEPDWALDRNVWPMGEMFVPDKYLKGLLAETWEITDQQTITVHLRHGIHWQNKPPVNGREFTAYDVQAHYDRILGTGGGYHKPAPMYGGMTSTWKKVTATDKYTVVFKFKIPCGGISLQAIADRLALNNIEAPEWVALGGPPSDNQAPMGPPPEAGGPPPPPKATGPLSDWKTVVGTGAWMLTGFVEGSSMTFSKNPTYWGHDPRHPENQVPYADKLTMLVISDPSTRLAAIRTGKIDVLPNITWQQADRLKATNQKLKIFKAAAGTGNGVVFKMTAKPFTDIRVRKALQMSIDRQAIAKSIYGGNSDGKPCGMVSQAYKGYAYSYNDWSQELKDEYAFNPEKAKQLLKDAGYPKGFKTNVVTALVSTEGTSGGFGGINTELIEAYKSYFNNIGVDMAVKVMDRVQVEFFLRSSKHDQLAVSAGGQSMPPNFLIDQFYSTSSDKGVFCVNDSVYDAARNKFWASKTPDEAARAVTEADRRVIEQHWGVWMVGGPNYNINQPHIKGYSGEYLGWGQGPVWSRLWVDKK